MCPPHVDQTCRSAQRWQILVPRLQQNQKLSAKNECYTSTPEEVLFDQDKSWDAWSKLAKPVDFRLQRQSTSLPLPSYKAKKTTPSESSLECMPAELLKMIFDETPEKQDIIALGLCSQSLWQHMLDRVETAYRQSAAPWAGKEIACTGTYLTDLPDSFEKDNLAVDSVTDTNGPARMVLARRFNWSAWSEYKQPEKSQQDAWRSALNVHRKASGVPESYWPKLEEDVLCGNLFPSVYAKAFPNLSPEKKGWVLRNQDTKEYVRICASSEHNRTYVVDDSTSQLLRLDDVLIMRICWTSNHNFRPDLDIKMELRRGNWAGHRFDVVMLADSLAGADGWKDITVEIVAEARKIRQQIRSSDEQE